MSRFLKVMIVLLAIAAMATPAIAANDYTFSVYGSARMSTFWNDYDQADDKGLTWDKQGNSRFGLKASKGAISGQYEVGTSGSVRVIKGVYAFDGGKLTLGQTYTPYTFFSDQVFDGDLDFIGYGATYEGRQPLIMVNLDSGFYFAAIKNDASARWTKIFEDATGDKVTDLFDDVDVDVTLPKLAIGYNGKAGNFSYGANLAYQTFELNATVLDDDSKLSEDVDSWLATFHGVIDMNPASIAFNVAYGQNAAEFGIGGTEVAYAGEDTDFLAGFVQVAFKANDQNTIRAGVGYASEDNDDYVQKETRISYFIHDQYTIAPGFFVVPEISFFDGMDQADGTDGEDSYHVGAKWQINF